MLSPREIAVLVLIGEGSSTKEIASTLQLSAFTVSGHRKNILRKLHLHSTAEMIAFALRNPHVLPSPVRVARGSATAIGT
jgi:DNA-binding NarL/FixJ family response regulator